MQMFRWVCDAPDQALQRSDNELSRRCLHKLPTGDSGCKCHANADHGLFVEMMELGHGSILQESCLLSKCQFCSLTWEDKISGPAETNSAILLIKV